MRFSASALGAVLLTSALLSCIWHGARGTTAAEPPKPAKPPALPPLVIDKNAPLLLDEAPKSKEKTDFLQMNDACYVCHNNYKDEPLAFDHAKADVGCVDCHGDSFEHRNDEDNITPPDKMYPPATIEKMCTSECHDTHDAPAAKVIARWQERCPQKTDVKTILCTDCHGKHRLERRVVRWDKATGKLLGKTGEKPVGKAVPSGAAKAKE